MEWSAYGCFGVGGGVGETGRIGVRQCPSMSKCTDMGFFDLCDTYIGLKQTDMGFFDLRDL